MKKTENRKGMVNKDSKEFHQEVFVKEVEMDKFFKDNPKAEGFEIYDHFRKLKGKK